MPFPSRLSGDLDAHGHAKRGKAVDAAHADSRLGFLVGEGACPQAGFKHGAFVEAAESYRAKTYGKIFGVSRQALVNDDLGAFTAIGARQGAAASGFVDTQLALLIEANPALSDAHAVFDATNHHNTAAAAASLEADLEAGRLAMRRQTGLGGSAIAIAPAYVLAPPELETDLEKVLSAVQATKTADVNPFATLKLVVEPRLASATRWYVAADPAMVDGVEFAYLEGAPGPQLETRAGFEVDGVEFKVRLDFAAAGSTTAAGIESASDGDCAGGAGDDVRRARQGARAGSLMTGFVRDIEGGSAGFGGAPASEVVNVSLEPGAMRVLPAGAGVTFTTPGQGLAQAVDFLRPGPRDRVGRRLDVRDASGRPDRAPGAAPPLAPLGRAPSPRGRHPERPDRRLSGGQLHRARMAVCRSTERSERRGRGDRRRA